MRCQGSSHTWMLVFPTSSLTAKTRLIFGNYALLVYTSCTFSALPANRVKPCPLSRQDKREVSGGAAEVTWSDMVPGHFGTTPPSTVSKGAAEEERGKEMKPLLGSRGAREEEGYSGGLGGGVWTQGRCPVCGGRCGSGRRASWAMKHLESGSKSWGKP